MSLIDSYKQILTALHLKVTDDGFVKNGEDEQVLVGKKSLVLPVKEQLAVGDMSNRIYFNPFRENSLASAPALVTEYIRGRFIEHLSIKTIWLISELADIAIKEAQHKKFNPEQCEFLVHAKDIDEVFLEKFSRFLDKITESGENPNILHIFSRKNGKIGDKEYKRAAFVSFPFFEALTSTDKELHKAAGINSMRPKDRKIIADLLKYIFPKITETNSYSVGSNSGICPYMDSLMLAVGQLIECINGCVEMFREYIDCSERIETPVDWFEAIQDLTAFQTELRVLAVGGDTQSAASGLETALSNVSSVPKPGTQFVASTPTGQPVVLTVQSGTTPVAINQMQSQVVMPANAITPTGAVDLSAMVAANPVLQHMMMLESVNQVPAMAQHYAHIQAQANQQAKQARWAFGRVPSATNMLSAANNAMNIFNQI